MVKQPNRTMFEYYIEYHSFSYKLERKLKNNNLVLPSGSRF